MKHRLLYLFPILLVLLSSCFNNKTAAPASTTTVPSGTFTGQFRLLRFSKKTGAYDTLSANIMLTMETSTGYKVTGDTSTIQAGSYGDYGISTLNSNIVFQDKTYPTPTKTHLNGQYQYQYDGTTLQMVANSALDTLSLQYNLTKTGN